MSYLVRPVIPMTTVSRVRGMYRLAMYSRYVLPGFSVVVQQHTPTLQTNQKLERRCNGLFLDNGRHPRC